MSKVYFLATAAASLVGIVLLAKGWKRTGALVLGLCIAAFLALMPWGTFDLLIKENKNLAQWAAPRMKAIRLGWFGFSAGFGLLIGTIMACAKPAGGRSPGWEVPKEQKGLDKALEACLTAKAAEEGTLLGMEATGREVFLDDRSREAHMQVVGPTRSGKSQLLFALSAQDMKRGMPVFFMEAKGDHGDFDQFLALAQRCGRSHDVRYFNPQDPRSMTFNPIRKLPGQDATALANQIARVIGREPTSSGEGQDYYRSVDYAKIQNMAEVFWNTGLDFTLRDCFLYFGHEECRARAFMLCKDEKVREAARHEFEKNPDTTALTSAISPWTTGPLGTLLNTYSPQIELDKVFERNQLAYFAIPIGHLQVLANPLGRMLISGMLSVAAWRQQRRDKPGPAAVILDEFAEFATPAFASFIATVGSARLWTILSHQDLGQLKKVQGMPPDAFNSAVFNNTSGCKVCFRSPDPEDAEFWASILGTFQTFEDTERVTKSFLGVRKTGEMSRRSVEHFKVHPNKLKSLPAGVALVFAPGRQDCLVRTARVFRCVNAKEAWLSPVPGDGKEGLDLESALRAPQKAGKMNQKEARA
jgi:hypothetical protein